MFWQFLPVRLKAFVWNGHIENLPKIWKFQNAPIPIIDPHDTSLIFTTLRAFTIIGVIVPKDCTYQPDYGCV